MQLGGQGNMRVRSSPFGTQAAAAQPLDGGQDFFGGWEDTPMAPAPAPQYAVSAPMAGAGVLPPPSGGPGIMPPHMQPAQQTNDWPQMQPQVGYNQQPGFQQPQQSFQQPQQQPGMGFQQPQQPQAPQMPQMGQMGSMFAASMAAAALGGGDVNQAMGSAVMNEGMNALSSTGLSRWFPYFFASLQGQFNVSQGFVMRKTLLLLCPFVKQTQGAPTQSWGSDDSTPMSHKATGSAEFLKVDINEPDLYIPLMSYFTYIIVYCVQRGMAAEFKPEILAATFSFAMVLFILEVIAAKMGFFIAGSQVSVLELMGTCGYKFVHVLLMVLLRIGLGSNKLYYVPFAYLAACSGFALRRFMSRFEQSHMQQYGTQPSAIHGHIILGLAIAQIPLCWLLTPAVAAAAPVAAAVAAATS